MSQPLNNNRDNVVDMIAETLRHRYEDEAELIRVAARADAADEANDLKLMDQLETRERGLQERMQIAERSAGLVINALDIAGYDVDGLIDDARTIAARRAAEQ